MLRETLRKNLLRALDDEAIKKLSKLRYRDWGRLLRKLLEWYRGL